MDDCLFCKIIEGGIPAYKVYEDDNFLAFLDINPINPGHTLIIPKEHYENIYELPDELMEKAGPLIKKIALAIKRGTSAEGINLGMNNEKAANQLVPHAHFHIMPRFAGDGHTHWQGTPYLGKEAEQVAEKIKKNI